MFLVGKTGGTLGAGRAGGDRGLGWADLSCESVPHAGVGGGTCT